MLLRSTVFWANVNSKIDHPRWSLAIEVLGNTFGRTPTPLYNGYEQDDAHLYDENKREFFY
jgi:sulfoxide reductase catalytic subunit YedY